MSTAQRRLELWAEMFDPSSRSFLASSPPGPGLAIDLGCGSGHTTRLLAEALQPRHCVGLDASPAHLEVARTTTADGIQFIEHDVTRVPFPPGPADLIYCRFLLPHLPDPFAAVHLWAGELRAGGRILLDEVEQIRGDEDDAGPIHRYLELATSLQDQRGGQRPEIGARLGSATWSAPLRLISNQVVTLRPPARVVVPIFLLNLRAWRRDPSMEERVTVLDHLQSELDSMAASPTPAPIAWQLRQVVLEIQS